MRRNSDHRFAETKCIDSTVIRKDPRRRNVRFAEIAGGKMAECAAIFCCCPCGLANLLFLAAVRLPAGLCRRAVQKRFLIRRAKKKAKLFDSGSGSNGGCSSGSSRSGSTGDDGFLEFTGTQGNSVLVIGDIWPVKSPTAEVWPKFCGRGFWRSLSQKDDH